MLKNAPEWRPLQVQKPVYSLLTHNKFALVQTKQDKALGRLCCPLLYRHMLALPFYRVFHLSTKHQSHCKGSCATTNSVVEACFLHGITRNGVQTSSCFEGTKM